jgi:hypothetical protein
MEGLKTQILYHESENYIYKHVYIQITKSETNYGFRLK